GHFLYSNSQPVVNQTLYVSITNNSTTPFLDTITTNSSGMYSATYALNFLGSSQGVIQLFFNCNHSDSLWTTYGPGNYTIIQNYTCLLPGSFQLSGNVTPHATGDTILVELFELSDTITPLQVAGGSSGNYSFLLQSAG